MLIYLILLLRLFKELNEYTDCKMYVGKGVPVTCLIVLQSLMEMEQPSRTALLSASALVNTFCQTTECEAHRDVISIVRMLTEKLGHQCKPSSAAEKDQASVFRSTSTF